MKNVFFLFFLFFMGLKCYSQVTPGPHPQIEKQAKRLAVIHAGERERPDTLTPIYLPKEKFDLFLKNLQKKKTGGYIHDFEKTPYKDPNRVFKDGYKAFSGYTNGCLVEVPQKNYKPFIYYTWYCDDFGRIIIETLTSYNRIW